MWASPPSQFLNYLTWKSLRVYVRTPYLHAQLKTLPYITIPLPNLTFSYCIQAAGLCHYELLTLQEILSFTHPLKWVKGRAVPDLTIGRLVLPDLAIGGYIRQFLTLSRILLHFYCFLTSREMRGNCNSAVVWEQSWRINCHATLLSAWAAWIPETKPLLVFSAHTLAHLDGSFAMLRPGFLKLKGG